MGGYMKKAHRIKNMYVVWKNADDGKKTGRCWTPFSETWSTPKLWEKRLRLI